MKWQEREKKVKELLEIVGINRSGYAGILPSGKLVDRRENPDALPVPKNDSLGIAEPKELPKPPKK